MQAEGIKICKRKESKYAGDRKTKYLMCASGRNKKYVSRRKKWHGEEGIKKFTIERNYEER